MHVSICESVCVCLHAHVFQHFSSAAITNLMPQCMRRTSNSPCMHHRLSIWPSEQTQQQAGPMLLCTVCVHMCVCVHVCVCVCVCVRACVGRVNNVRTDMYSILALT